MTFWPLKMRGSLFLPPKNKCNNNTLQYFSNPSSVSSSKLTSLQICFQLILTTIQRYRNNICILQMRELRDREIKQFAQDYTARRCWSCQESLKEYAQCAYELAKSLLWINTLCIRLNRRGWSVNHPGKWEVGAVEIHHTITILWYIYH